MLIRGTQAASVSAEGDGPSEAGGRDGRDRGGKKGGGEDETHLQRREREMKRG